ncbi:cyclin family protein [Desulfosarcina alkanivorans]|uniref:hypothetical protein n=1 Tax=Desulfosarcina alkanivorans TaxID=571177 RepID=UPI0012D31CD7|nr:hypothetical protein [Desulfosarcina alkanivorans]
MLDTASITIVSDRPENIATQLGKFMLPGKQVTEHRAKHSYLPDIFARRTYFSFGSLSKVYLIHEKISGAQGIDAVLVIHDVSLVDLLQVEQILNTISAVTDFHFCRIEFTWDFFPDLGITAPELQRKIIQPLHLAYSRIAWPRWSRIYNDRTTFYINTRKSKLQSKSYIRPKKPGSAAIEFVRLELIAKTAWLNGIGLKKPSDFLGLKFQHIVHQVEWLEFDWHELRRHSQLHLLSGGFWFANLLNDWQYLGISYCLSQYRKHRICPSQCKYRGNVKSCPLHASYNRRITGNDLIDKIQACPHAKANQRFEKDFCKQSRNSQFMMNTMEQAYLGWNQPPLFPVTIQPVTAKPKKKRPRRRRKTSVKVPIGLSRLF